jgi:transcriptional regulator with XRE-family HTH domain
MFSCMGETLRRIRKERGKTLQELGKEAGLGRGQLSRIENSHQEATLNTLAKILSSQGISRHEFFRRFDLVESEAAALEQSAEVDAAGGSAPASEWPAEIRDVLAKLESFVGRTFRQPRPVAQGAIELGDLVILFRVVPKRSPSAQAAEERPAAPAAAAKPVRAKRTKKS